MQAQSPRLYEPLHSLSSSGGGGGVGRSGGDGGGRGSSEGSELVLPMMLTVMSLGNARACSSVCAHHLINHDDAVTLTSHMSRDAC